MFQNFNLMYVRFEYYIMPIVDRHKKDSNKKTGRQLSEQGL